MADTFVKKPMVVVGTKDQVVAEMGANDFGIATDVSFYNTTETDALLASKQPIGDYATNEALSSGLATKQPAGDYATNSALASGLAQKQDVATAVNYDNISNCITEIPQDINLELSSDGTLTLKAGSKVYRPGGPFGFYAETTTADASITRTDSQDCMVWRYSSGGLGIFPAQLFYSGETAPTQYQFMFWYDTTDNLCKYTSNSGTTWSLSGSFPICVVETDGTKISAIKQVFNGFGYVGSTIFVLPGVKGLIPNGRNADGSLKSNVLNITSVKTYTITATTTKAIRLSSAGLFGYRGYVVSDTNPSVNFSLWYNPVENVLYDTGAGTPSPLNTTVGGSVEFDGTRITSFIPKTVFHAVDYNEFNEHRIVDFQEPTSSNDYTWYRKYSDGWVEQGGSPTGKSSTVYTGTLPIEMADTNYTLVVSFNVKSSGTGGYSAGWDTKTTTGFTTRGFGAGSSTVNTPNWYVCGMSAQ